MSKQYLKDMSPEAVIKMLKQGEVVYTEDSKGKEFSYKMIDGVIVAYDESKGTVSGYNRSLYVTDKAYFNNNHGCIKPETNHWYRTRSGRAVFIATLARPGYYIMQGYVEGLMSPEYWAENGEYDKDRPNNPMDLVEDITNDSED